MRYLQCTEIQRFFPLAQPPPVRRKQKRDMIIRRRWEPERLLQPYLARHRTQQIASSDNLSDAARRIVGHNCQLIGVYAV